MRIRPPRVVNYFAFAAAAAVLSAVVSAEPLEYDPKFDSKAARPWKESEIVLPAFPEDRNLLRIPLAAGDTLTLFLDPQSVSRSADGVARFSVVVESARGARNVFYEGMRCETREYKTYAVGTSERRLEPVKDPRWQYIPYYDVNAFRYHLFKHYLCDDYGARTPNAVVQRIVRGPLGHD